MAHAVADPPRPEDPATPPPGQPADRAPPKLRADLVPSIEACCEDSCCYLDWIASRGEARD